MLTSDTCDKLNPGSCGSDQQNTSELPNVHSPGRPNFRGFKYSAKDLGFRDSEKLPNHPEVTTNYWTEENSTGLDMQCSSSDAAGCRLKANNWHYHRVWGDLPYTVWLNWQCTLKHFCSIMIDQDWSWLIKSNLIIVDLLYHAQRWSRWSSFGQFLVIIGDFP